MTNRKFALLAACIALCGGIAWALDSQTISLPAGTSGVDAVLVPGSGGSVMLSDNGWFDEIDLKVDFDPDGAVRVNGVFVGTTDAAHNHSVCIEIISTSTGYEANVTVTDEDLQLVVGSKLGVDIGVDAPAAARAEGALVTSLESD